MHIAIDCLKPDMKSVKISNDTKSTKLRNVFFEFFYTKLYIKSTSIKEKKDINN